ncbi:DUF4832 domain-containing protein [Isosphaeraceae bacterium EP7]
MRARWIALLVALLSPAAHAEDIVVRPAAAPGPLDNPLKGWCPYARGAVRQPYTMVYLDASWKDLEPEEGRYAFEEWERKSWQSPAVVGKHVVLRIHADYPRRPSGLPGWLKDKGVKLTPYTEHGGGLSPDYDDPRMVDAMLRLIAAMGRRYDSDPRVGFLQLGLIGFWGEWHTWPHDELFPKPETRRKVIQAYREAFPNKLLMARTADEPAGTQPWLGFHDDMFPEDTDDGHDYSFLAKIRRAGRSDNWKVAPVGGEMVPGHARDWLGKGFDQSMTMAERAHFSWVGPYSPAQDRTQAPEFRKNSEALVRKLGYQFRLTEIRHPGRVERGGKLPLAIEGENEGVAPFYYPWPVDVALLDDAGKVVATLPLKADIRTWLPGAFKIEESTIVDVPPGRYRLALGIISPLAGKPDVRFANDLPVEGGRAVLSTIEVSPAP